MINIETLCLIVQIISVFWGFRELLFTSRAEELAVLREFSDALVRNLFPKSLWGQEVHRCALNEVVAVKGKRPSTLIRGSQLLFLSVNCDVLLQSLGSGF